MNCSIYGTVKSTPLVVADYTIYEVENADNKYVVISKDIQSAKDVIFIQINQRVFVHGEIPIEDGFDKIIFTERSMIGLNPRIKKYSDKE